MSEETENEYEYDEDVVLFLEAMEDKDVDRTLERLNVLLERVLDVEDDLHQDITSPKILTEMHTIIKESFDIPQKMLAIKIRSRSPRRKAVMFIKAMENALRRVKK